MSSPFIVDQAGAGEFQVERTRFAGSANVPSALSAQRENSFLSISA
jgi:hypothetical protein